MKKTAICLNENSSDTLVMPENLYKTKTEEAFHKNNSWGLSTDIDPHGCNATFILPNFL